MESKPTVAADYSPASVEFAQAASLYIASKLGDLRDDFVIVATNFKDDAVIAARRHRMGYVCFRQMFSEIWKNSVGWANSSAT